MGVTTKVKYKTSDNKYYDTEKEANISQNRINENNLIPWRTELYDNWFKGVCEGDSEGSNELRALRDSGTTDGKAIQSIVCDAIVTNIKGLLELSSSFSHSEGKK